MTAKKSAKAKGAAKTPAKTAKADKSIGRWVAVDSLVPWEKNPRDNDKAVPGIAVSIKRFGFVAPVLVWTSKGRMVGGHTRLKAMRALLAEDPRFVPLGAPGPGLVPVRFHEFKNEHEANLYALADNKLAESAEWDDELLATVAADFEDDELAIAGFDDDEIADLTDDETETDAGGDKGDDDVVPEPPRKVVTKKGDLWLLGEHRLLCGDAREPADVKRLMKGAHAAFACHDVPYGISAVQNGLGDGKRHGKGAAKRGTFKPIEGDDEPFDPAHLLESAEVVFLWGANHFADKLPASAAWVVWDKRDGIPEKEGKAFSDCELAWVSKGGSVRIKRHTWDGFIRASERNEPRVHPTQKPVVLIGEIVADHTEPKDLVVDWYQGSGTTIIACERQDRRCYGMEIDPAYCDVIVERWQRATGKKATRVPAKAKTTKAKAAA